MTSGSEARIAAEASLLRAVADDDVDAIATTLGSSGCAEILLHMQVKASWGDAADETAFFHSVVSYGLKFRLGDRAVQLARRNGKQKAAEALGTLCHSYGLPLFSFDEERIMAEARLLKAIAEDDGDAVLRILEGVVPPAVLLNLQVKAVLDNESDAAAFFHPVASYGLSFEIDDDAERLAERSGRLNAARALRAKALKTKAPQHTEPTSAAMLHVTLRDCCGELLGELDIDNSGRIGDLTAALNEVVPLPEGDVRRELLSGELLLDPDLPVASYFPDSQSVDLSSMIAAGGTYQARIGGGRMIRGGGPDIVVRLMRNGQAFFELTCRPIDRGHCAGASGGLELCASGAWCITNSGVRVTLNKKKTSVMNRGRWGETKVIDLEQQLLFSQTEGGLVSLKSPVSEHLSSLRAVHVEPGTQFERLSPQ
mmetsp:Transcript_28688/g.78890  ORF Transcript_28688/g.78890 Transcript_28688/m.78890 type:complete len:426 (+) Transcript_28688:106-1383(+)|eukprot:CAMPEP_0117528832 /NCGR_PEP_ID=MMETSP0784-20121206/37520_1 /TAXON_ID=39447 /ORGANISM="" /LENGTH=425 /DNA_ID=CAMNT_0005325135 /DNA_START=106 /DNA_END=1383 /DNA_ORIENTATION=+